MYRDGHRLRFCRRVLPLKNLDHGATEMAIDRCVHKLSRVENDPEHIEGDFVGFVVQLQRLIHPSIVILAHCLKQHVQL